jgi:hypothetical protein
MTVRELLLQRKTLLEGIKVYDLIDEYLDSYLSKDNREPENFILFSEEEYVTESTIVTVRQDIFKLKSELTNSLDKLEGAEVL